ncbi:YaaR family protein [Clostridium sporogenes]|uniref:DUF327 family protein n=1 Tax=Clostridium botulinum TaxID=1491 RepID=A0A6M0SWX5_CLOBO|nr:YaaR family protein [Clostridium sporogenes]NFA59653.1 DUF327 family protein [Clostridium botulinum]NFI73333.1 DUF327 family protein [Clostridium sporogenes]NFL72823.1 DUF327 family protein [Clostridium sporogenes]NFM23192.1 DUF327 family protein [Clostridium sporogenes]NFP61419.1 DUF327 family protein [Clostridium sporogenes]
MEIKRVGTNAPIQTENKRTIENRKGFSQSFNFARQQKSEQELKNMMDNINKKGNRLAVTKCYADVKAYKKMIKEYLKSVLEYMYSVKKDISFWQTQYFITVEIVDEKLQELTEMLLSAEKENLDIAKTIDDITGLIVDIYK